ncbi:hypothetical protein ACFFWC_07355 [Plantactinospora siamensis]|uniref:Uncharacterized protein n=1 Tax=Plantactinospora siamensis TaxID=555372 RepID=A0ABV6NXB5_9ACTN
MTIIPLPVSRRLPQGRNSPVRAAGDWWTRRRADILLWTLVAVVALAALGALAVTLGGAGGGPRGSERAGDTLELLNWCWSRLAG